MLVRVEGGPQILGYPALALIFFVAAAVAGVVVGVLVVRERFFTAEESAEGVSENESRTAARQPQPTAPARSSRAPAMPGSIRGLGFGGGAEPA